MSGAATTMLAREEMTGPATIAATAAAANARPALEHPWPAATDAPSVLLVSASWWAFPAQMAIRLAARGIRVDAVCPAGHPLRVGQAVRRCFAYRGSAPVGSLLRAIRAAGPALILPCDDRAEAHLHAVRERAPDLAAVIDRSLGAGPVHRRRDVIDLARSAAIAAPEMVQLDGPSSVQAAIAAFGLPVVLKQDGSWGGLGVVVAATQAQAGAAYARLSQPPGIIVALKRRFVDRDCFVRRRGRVTVNAQRFAPGRPVTCAVASWQGEMLACSVVEVLRARGATGASTVVRRIEHAGIVETARRMISAMGLSGLSGFDFVLDEATGTAALLECNKRATPLCHLNFGPGADPLDALVSAVFGEPLLPAAAALARDTVAFFPQAWLLEPDQPLLHAAHHDVPWSDPALVRELLRAPWPERGLLARLTQLLLRRPAPRPWHIGQTEEISA